MEKSQRIDITTKGVRCELNKNMVNIVHTELYLLKFSEIIMDN
jgi:hypothetical protein